MAGSFLPGAEKPGQVLRAVNEALEFDMPDVDVEKEQILPVGRRQAEGAHLSVTAETKVVAQERRLRGDGLNGGPHRHPKSGGGVRVVAGNQVPVTLDVSDRRRDR